MNRYQSILDNTSASFLLSLKDAPVFPGRWTIVDGQLALLDDKGRTQLFDYEKGDELSDLLVEFLNMLPALAATARAHT